MLFSDPSNSPAETLVTELRDYPQWHRGRLRYGVWVVLPDDPRLLDYIEAAQQQLADLLHPNTQRQPHLTVFVCGFEAMTCVANDDFSPMQRQLQIERLRPWRGSNCTLPLGRPDSFASAAMLPVGDPDGQLERWRDALGSAASEVRQQAYMPHITLGLYRRRVSADVIRQRLGDIAAPPVSLAVRELHYVTYAARELFGPLTTHHRVSLDHADGADGPRP